VVVPLGETVMGSAHREVNLADEKRAEEAVAWLRDEQATLFEFTDSLFRALTIEDVYGAALVAIRRALGCNRASILLFDQAGVMRFVAWIGLSDEYRRAVEGHSPWSTDAKDPDPICVDDIEAHDLAEPIKTKIRSEGIRAAAFIPLVVEGRLIGKFTAYHSTPHDFSRGEINLAVTIARQLGFGIQQKRFEKARQQAEQAGHLLATIVEGSDDAIISKDLNGIITSWNRGAELLFGYAAGEVIGRPVTVLFPPDRHDEELRILERIRRGERVHHYETVRRRKDGTLVDVSLTISPIKDGFGRVVGASKIARDITERRAAQARHEVLTGEVQHRTKNLFAVVQSVVARSFAGKATVGEAQSAVMDRLSSLGKTHLLLMDQEWQGAELAEIVQAEMKPFADRVLAGGPSLLLSAKAAQNFALALHELATNAAKYGSLSSTTGRVYITWTITETNGIPQLTFRWQERGGPPVTRPGQKGFGSAVLEQVMGEYFDDPPRVDFASGGLCYELSGSLASVSDQEAAATTGG